MTCRKCAVATFMREEAERYGESDARRIRALAGSWQRKCTCKPRRTVLFWVREIRSRRERGMRRLPGRMEP